MPKIIFTTEDLMKGCRALKAKPKFSPGFDKMTPEAAETWLQMNVEQLCHSLNSGKYRVMPAIGFNVAKMSGQYRRLAKLTAIDTIVQDVTVEKLAPVCAERFSKYSYAYQTGKGTGKALHQFCVYAAAHPYAAKVDPRACFDNIDHDLLEKALNSFFNYRKTVELLMSFAKAPVIVEGQLTERSKGILQGSPISGLLCNIYFHALDQELESMGVPFLRYADDVVVFADDRQEALRLSKLVTGYLENKLRLKINAAKTCVDAAENLTYLGQTFTRDKNGAICMEAANENAAVHYEWSQNRPRNHHSSIDILSDGILRQKDYSAIFESETAEHSIPLETVNRINIFSGVILDSGFLEKAMQAGIYINVFGRDYSFIGRFTPAVPLKDQRLIFEQLTIYNEQTRRIMLAKEFDLASVHNLRLNIRYYNKNKPNEIYTKALNAINVCYSKMKKCEMYDQLLLTEAKIREHYYGCFDSFIAGSGFVFGSRSKRPPLNEVNALISFGNVVLYNYIATELYKSSLDIRVGFLHATNKRTESLNLDIAEVFKPLLVDRVVFSLINRKEINPSHFETAENGGIYLNEEGKRLFLRGFYNKLNTTLQLGETHVSYATLIDLEIQKLTRFFRAGVKYKAYRQVR